MPAHTRRSTLRGWTALAASALLIIGGITSVSAAEASPSPVNGAVRTTVNTVVDGDGHCKNGNPDVNTVVDGDGHCKNGNPDVNCNIYDGKQFVWLSGEPLSSHLSDGQYVFAVLVPGGQPDPNDGAADLLSTDVWTDRVFTITDGSLSYAGPHAFNSNKIRLAPYDDTTNPGGVYILAVCSLADRDESADPGPGVSPSDCKYDAFKIKSSDVPNPAVFPPVITKDAAGSYDRTFRWQVQKSVNQTRIEQSGTGATFHYTVLVTHDSGTDTNAAVTGTIDIFNPNDDPVTATVTDALSDGTVCDVTGGVDATLATGDNHFDYVCALTALPQGGLQNTATVVWDEQVLPTASTLMAGTAGFTFTNIDFAANLVDDCTDVTDSYAGDLGTVCITDSSPTQFTYDRSVTGTAGTCTDYDNTATFTTNTTGTTGSASQRATLCVGADLTVSKTATPAFSRTYGWNITKQVDKTTVTTSANTATFNYTVGASQTGFTDSAWQVTGQITVTNPNDWESVTLTGVTDAISNGGSCSITSGSPTATIAAGGSVTLGYTCTYAVKPSPAGFTNTGTATWNAATAHTPHGTASGTATGAFGDPTSTTNKTITVTDTFQGTTTTLGTLTATDAAPFTTGTFTYSRTVNVPTTACATYTNTAAIVETGQNAGASVQACRAQNTGGFTMGYWTNKNGQKVIADKYVAMCAKLAGYPNVLTGMPAPCSANSLKSYVTSIISAANASGDGAPMFKGQFLATALSVTTTPALGTTGILVDPSIFGTGCMTVNDLLAFGNANYATLSQNKTTFMAVKSVYDDINNNRAYTCLP